MSGRKDIELDDCTIKFSKTKKPHTKQDDHNKLKVEYKVIREVPTKIASVTLRNNRYMTNHKFLDFYENYDKINWIKRFNLTPVFEDIKVDTTDPFLSDFTSAVLVMDINLVDYLMHEFKAFLKESFEDQEINRRSLCQLLKETVENNPHLKCYSKHIDRMFENSIVNEALCILSEEGEFFDYFNRRPFLEQDPRMMLFFLICHFSLSTHTNNQSKLEGTVSCQLNNFDDFKFEEEAFYVNKSIFSCLPSMEDFNNLYDLLRPNAKKFFLHVRIPEEKQYNNYNFLYKFSRFSADNEIVFSPFNVFQINKISKNLNNVSVEASIVTAKSLNDFFFSYQKPLGLHSCLLNRKRFVDCSC